LDNFEERRRNAEEKRLKRDQLLQAQREKNKRIAAEQKRRIRQKLCYNCGKPNDQADHPRPLACKACFAEGTTERYSERRRMAQREHSKNRDSPVMVRLLQDVIAKQ